MTACWAPRVASSSLLPPLPTVMGTPQTGQIVHFSTSFTHLDPHRATFSPRALSSDLRQRTHPIDAGRASRPLCNPAAVLRAIHRSSKPEPPRAAALITRCLLPKWLLAISERASAGSCDTWAAATTNIGRAAAGTQEIGHALARSRDVQSRGKKTKAENLRARIRAQHPPHLGNPPLGPLLGSPDRSSLEGSREATFH